MPEYTVNWIAFGYVVGFVVTYVVNAIVVRNDPVPGRFLVRRVVLWPAFLPVLIVHLVRG